MREEKHIFETCGKHNPYTVPEGYFDTLTARVMANIPAEETKIISIAPKKRANWMPWSGLVAACMIGALVCINVFDTPNQEESAPLTSKVTLQNDIYDESVQEDALNYAMVDYNDVYNYLSGSGY